MVTSRLVGWVQTHIALCAVLYWLFSNMVLQMPPPDDKSSKFYKWSFGVLHTVAGAVPRVASNFIPPDSWVYKFLAGGNGSAPARP